MTATGTAGEGPMLTCFGRRYTENPNHFSKMGGLLLTGNKLRISKWHLVSIEGPKREDGICLMHGRI